MIVTYIAVALIIAAIAYEVVYGYKVRKAKAGVKKLAEVMRVIEKPVKLTLHLPSYYAQENGLYYNPKRNKLKLAGPRTRLQTMNRLGYTEFIGSV